MNKTEPNSKASLSNRFLLIALLAAYSVVVHLSVANDDPELASGLLLGAVLAGLVVALRRGRVLIIAVLGAVAAGGALFLLEGRTLELLYLPPILVNLILFIVFGRTLLPGKTPLVTRFVMMVRGELHPVIRRYTVRLTWVWTVFFALMTLQSVTLALYAPPYVWSLFTNFINYALVVLVFVVEYCVRIRYLTHFPHPGFIAFCRTLVKTDLRSLAG